MYKMLWGFILQGPISHAASLAAEKQAHLGWNAAAI